MNTAKSIPQASANPSLAALINARFSHPVRLLAPMEGLTDPLMRKLLTQIAAVAGRPYDWTVSEFIRVTYYPVPASVFYKFVPELHDGGKTHSGTPVHVQLLGSEPLAMATSAQVAANLGAEAIDLNFGCPAKTVNKHKGGAVLLDDPDTIYRIIKSVRTAVSASTPVSAKIRLGYNDTLRTADIGQAVKDAGASWLTVHARTKQDGYKPPAYWHKIAPLTTLGLPVIANGEIWKPEDAAACIIQAQTPHLMLGRGAVTRPDLVAVIDGQKALSWGTLRDYQLQFLDDATDNPKGLLGRYKQWLGMLSKYYPQAARLWGLVKKERELATVRSYLAATNNH